MKVYLLPLLTLMTLTTAAHASEGWGPRDQEDARQEQPRRERPEREYQTDREDDVIVRRETRRVIERDDCGRGYDCDGRRPPRVLPAPAACRVVWNRGIWTIIDGLGEVVAQNRGQHFLRRAMYQNGPEQDGRCVDYSEDRRW